MICKFCGMDSVTTEVCSWCGKSLRVPAISELAVADPDVKTDPDPQDIVGAPTSLAANSASKAIPATGPEAATRVADGLASESRSPTGAAASVHKIAPGMPPPVRSRGPAPAVPVPSTQPAPPSMPLATTVQQGALNNALATTVPLAGSNAANAAALENALLPDAGFSLRPQDVTPEAPAGLERDLTTRTLQAAPVENSPGEAAVAVPVEATIGTGVTPPRETTPLVPALTLDDRQRKAAVDAALADGGPSPRTLVLRYCGVFALLLIVTGALCYIGKQFYVVPMLVAMFVSALLLPVMHVTPWADEDADDLIWFVVLTLVFGPLVALIIYSVISLVRQGCNASILGCLIVAALVRITAEVASGGVTLNNLLPMTFPFASLSHIDGRLVRALLLNWSSFTALAGWYAASMFHKEDE